MKKYIFLVFLFFIHLQTFSSADLDRLAQSFDLMQMEKISAYDFGLSAIEYWDIKKNQKEINNQKYCLEINGIRKVIESESRSEQTSGKKSIELFNDYLDQVKNFDSFCKKVMAPVLKKKANS